MKSLKTKFQQPLDPRQLKRIENVHGGFLYQHLYVVGCILLAPTAKVKTINLNQSWREIHKDLVGIIC